MDDIAFETMADVLESTSTADLTAVVDSIEQLTAWLVGGFAATIALLLVLGLFLILSRR